jgi:hypothetical protein
LFVWVAARVWEPVPEPEAEEGGMPFVWGAEVAVAIVGVAEDDQDLV